MNTQLFTLAIIEIILSLVFTVIIMYVSYRMLKVMFFKKTEITGNNLAFTVFAAGIILSIGLILSEILPSITNVIRLSVTQNESIEMLTIIQYSGIYLIIGFLMAVFINASVFILFSMLTRGVNEFKEIQKNNLAVSILVVMILLSITLIAKESIALLISSLIPYPEVTNYF